MEEHGIDFTEPLSEQYPDERIGWDLEQTLTMPYIHLIASIGTSTHAATFISRFCSSSSATVSNCFVENRWGMGNFTAIYLQLSVQAEERLLKGQGDLVLRHVVVQYKSSEDEKITNVIVIPSLKRLARAFG